MHMASYTIARLVLSSKLIDEAGGIEERVIWAVPKSARYPEGVRYRLAYVPKGAEKPAILYDNHHPKGHHRHIGERQLPYDFTGVERLLEDFRRDIEAMNEDA